MIATADGTTASAISRSRSVPFIPTTTVDSQRVRAPACWVNAVAPIRPYRRGQVYAGGPGHGLASVAGCEGCTRMGR